jgi:predicted DNA-binding transcriptional regulator AlpA
MPAKKKPAGAAAPKRLHIDKRAEMLVATTIGGDDELLNTRETAKWLGISEQWLEIARVRGNGPPYEKIAPRIVRYRVGKVKAWLDERSRTCTKEHAA